jgi:SAM-dependent methyltransferase
MTAAAPGPGHARESYDAFAGAYDAFTAHHRYDEWTALIERLARGAGLSGRRLLDAGCGTGKSFLPFLERGYEVTACDASPEMLARAREKADGRARLCEADLRRLPVFGEFDLVCCLDDVVNYLHSDAELAAAAAGLRRNLAPGGVLVFDANTLLAYRSFFASLSVVISPDRVLIWRGATDPGFAVGGLARAAFEALERGSDGAWTARLHAHAQRHHPERAIRAALRAAGFAHVRAYGMQPDGTVAPAVSEERDSKALYVATA